MKIKIPFLAVFLSLFLIVSVAHALPLSLDDETAGVIPGDATNDILDDIYGSGTTSREGYYGAKVILNTPAEVTFEYLGKEASYNNLFRVYYGGHWNTLFSTDSAEVGDSRTFSLEAGLIGFRFAVFDGNTWLGRVDNGSNPDNSDPDLINFFVSWEDDLVGFSLIAFLDDAGAGDDDNHDDMAIRITARAVPEPSTILLLSGGLLGLAAIRRKK